MINSPAGYSKRSKETVYANSHTKKMIQLSPKAKIKLAPLSPNEFKGNRSNNIFDFSLRKAIIPKTELMRVIESKAKDYESAIKQHLGVNPVSRESNREEYSPMVKIISNSPTKFHFYSEHSMDNSLETMETKEKQLSSDIKLLDKRSHDLKKRAYNLSDVPNFDLNDKKMKKLRGSIEEIRLKIGKSNNN